MSLNNTGSKTLIIRFMVSYMIIVIITLIIGVVGYRETVKIVEGEVQRANLAVLEQIKDIMDSRLSEIETEAYKIAINPKVYAMASAKAIPQESYYYELKELVDEMSHYMLQDYVYTFFIYLKNNQYIIYPETVYKADFFFEHVFKYNDMSITEWVDEVLNERNNRKYLPAASVTIDNTQQILIPYLQTMPIGYQKNDIGTITVLIKKDEINKLLQRIDAFDEGWFYIESEDVGMITSIGTEGQGEVPFNIEADTTKGFNETTVNGKDMMIAYTDSGYNDWRYVLALPSKIVMLKANYIKQLIWIVLLVSLLLGSVIAYFMALHNVKPLYGIIKMLKEFTGDESSRDKEGYEFLKGSINKLIRNNKDLQESVDKQMPLIEAAFFTGLFKGEYKSKNEVDAISSYIGIKIRGVAFVVLILRLYRNDNIIDIDEHVIKVRNLTRLLVRKTIKEHIETEYISDIDNNNIAFIVPFSSSENSKCVQDTEKIANEIYNELYQLYNLKVFFAAGSIYSDFMETDQSYEKARQTFDFKLKYKNSIIVWYDDIPKQGEGYLYPIDIEQKIINYAKSGNFDQVERQLEFIYNENFINRKLFAGMGKELIGEMKSTIIKLLSRCSFEGDMRNYIQNINMNGYVDEIFDSIKSTYRSICEKIAEQKNNSNEELKNGIIEYINENYMQPDICLYKVASHFGMSEGYLCHFFKDKTGENFTNYVESLRIYNANILLKDSDCTINNIAMQVGYNSVQSFRRAFKRHNGVSPSEFR